MTNTPVNPFAADLEAYQKSQQQQALAPDEDTNRAEEQAAEREQAQVQAPETQVPKEASDEVVSSPDQAQDSWFSRMKGGLSKSRAQLGEGLMTLLVGGKEIDDELFEEIEDQLLMADLGVEATQTIMNSLTEKVGRGDLTNAQALRRELVLELVQLLEPAVQPLEVDTAKAPFVILMVGVNGVGKTTTIGKLAKRFKAEGKSVLLAAGDTFRAAATEQLVVWGERNQVDVVHQSEGADAASVIHDALGRAKARGVDVVIADTAGRLHNKVGLMEELKKVVRVIKKFDESAPHESMIVVDAGTGLNAIQQIQTFKEAVNLTGVTVTKLDGTAKGGMVFHVAQSTQVPLRFIGVGEAVDDLQSFDAAEFVEALLGQ